LSHLLCLAHQVDELGLQDGAERGKLAVTAAGAHGIIEVTMGYRGWVTDLGLYYYNIYLNICHSV